MNASSESGLCATWMVLAMELLLRLLLKLVQRRLVLEVFDPLRRRFLGIVGQEILLRPALGGWIVLQPGNGAPNQIPEQMTRRLAQDRIRQRLRRSKVSDLQVKHGG